MHCDNWYDTYSTLVDPIHFTNNCNKHLEHDLIFIRCSIIMFVHIFSKLTSIIYIWSAALYTLCTAIWYVNTRSWPVINEVLRNVSATCMCIAYMLISCALSARNGQHIQLRSFGTFCWCSHSSIASSAENTDSPHHKLIHYECFTENSWIEPDRPCRWPSSPPCIHLPTVLRTVNACACTSARILYVCYQMIVYEKLSRVKRKICHWRVAK